MKPFLILIFAATAFFVSIPMTAKAQTDAHDAARLRMRPIGSPSAIDRYPSQNNTNASRQTRELGTRQTARMQQYAMPGPNAPMLPPSSSMPLPSGGFNPPAMNSGSMNSGSMNSGAPAPASPPSMTPSNMPAPTSIPTQRLASPPPRNLPTSSSDLAPLTQPSLQPDYATMNNCNCVSAPSDYSVVDCGVYSPVSYAVPDAVSSTPVYPPAAAPVSGPPQMPPASAAPIGSLITLGQEANLVQVGQGLWGQPVAYVPGQGIRNWLRYFFP